MSQAIFAIILALALPVSAVGEEEADRQERYEQRSDRNKNGFGGYIKRLWIPLEPRALQGAPVKISDFSLPKYSGDWVVEFENHSSHVVVAIEFGFMAFDIWNDCAIDTTETIFDARGLAPTGWRARGPSQGEIDRREHWPGTATKGKGKVAPKFGSSPSFLFPHPHRKSR